MGRNSLPGSCMRNTCIRYCLVMVTATCIFVIFYVESGWKARTSNIRQMQPNIRRDTWREPRDQEDMIEFRHPLSNVSLRVRLSLTSQEQRAILSQNYSLSDLPLPLPVTGTRPREMSRTRRRQLDLLGMKLPSFNRRYKSPCWESLLRTRRCLPYFFMIGAPKCGTTDLYLRLMKHPDVVQVPYKEPHWITRTRTESIKSESLRNPSAFTSYLFYFLKLSILMRNESNSMKISGDCSASTLWDNDIWTSLPRNDNPLEPVYTNADYVYKLNKNAKIIVLLRDPVQRLFSDYLYFEEKNRTKSPAIFHDHVIQTVRLFTACMATFSVRSCVYNAELNTMLTVRLRIGMYYIFLTEWYKKFPAEQILVFNLDDYAKHTKKYLHKVFQFLELRPLNEKVMDEIADRKRANTRSDADKNVGTMWPETRKVLQDFYRPFNKRLYELLDRHTCTS